MLNYTSPVCPLTDSYEYDYELLIEFCALAKIGSIKQIFNKTNLQFIFINQLIGVKSINRSKYNKYFIIDIYIYMLPFTEGVITIMFEEHVYIWKSQYII